jgi:hypothetical protein
MGKGRLEKPTNQMFGKESWPCHGSSGYSLASHSRGPGSRPMGFVVNKVALGHVFLWVLQFSLSISFYRGSPLSYIINRPIRDCSSESQSDPIDMNMNMNVNMVTKTHSHTYAKIIWIKIWEIKSVYTVRNMERETNEFYNFMDNYYLQKK